MCGAVERRGGEGGRHRSEQADVRRRGEGEAGAGQSRQKCGGVDRYTGVLDPTVSLGVRAPNSPYVV